MRLFNLSLSFLAVGGASYALFKIKEAPAWLVIATLAMAAAALIPVLPELPRAVDAIVRTVEKIAELATPRRGGYDVPTAGAPQPVRPVRPEPHRAPVVVPPPRPNCAAIVMSNQGGWGASHGSGQTCSERLERARDTCNARVAGECGNYATGLWVAGIHCGIREPGRIVRNSFAAAGATENEAFGRAFQAAMARGFPPVSCRRRVSILAHEAAPRRYD